MFVIKNLDFTYLFRNFYKLYTINTIHAPNIGNIFEQTQHLFSRCAMDPCALYAASVRWSWSASADILWYNSLSIYRLGALFGSWNFILSKYSCLHMGQLFLECSAFAILRSKQSVQNVWLHLVVIVLFPSMSSWHIAHRAIFNKCYRIIYIIKFFFVNKM